MGIVHRVPPPNPRIQASRPIGAIFAILYVDVQLTLSILSTDEPRSARAEDIWTSYLKYAQPFDEALAKRWKGDMDGILIFSGLFSAVVTAFIVETYKLLQTDNTEASADLLVRIVAALEHNTAGAVAATIPINRTPATAISRSINCLWFTSLLSSITCALLATLVKQWSREYLQSVAEPAAIDHRARVRKRLDQSMKKFDADFFVGCIPLFLHLAVLLFMVGLVVFAFTI
ncbi:hypothetical protein OF83DRAFT_1066907, partial [Amylostereum chailletii]